MSSERKYTGMAKLFAIEERQQREKAAEKASANITAPAKPSGAVNILPPENISPAANTSPAETVAAPAIAPAEPLQFAAAEAVTAPAIFSRPEQHTRFPN